MTGDEFLNELHTIVMHGDLRDVAFIEKTLGAKFNPTMIFEDGQPDEHNKMYDVTLPGIDIWFSLHIMDGIQPLDKHGTPHKTVAVLNINGIYFKECSPITATQIENILSGNYTHKVSGSRSIGGGIASDAAMPEVGNNGMQVHVQYIVHFGKTEAEDEITLPQLRQTAIQTQ